jgi:hypothetical protein
MKILFILLLFPGLLLAQMKMAGIGSLKIDGSTIKAMDSISIETGVPIKNGTYSSTSLMYGTEKTKAITLIKPSEEDLFIPMNDPRFIPHPDFTVYHVDYYTISDVPFRGLYLFFYKNYLYRIECDGDAEIYDAMKLKYGGEKIDLKEKKIKCRSGLGIEYDEVEKTYTRTWSLNNSAIKCEGSTSVFFDSKCKKMTATMFYIESVKTSSIANKVISDAIKNKKDSKDEKKKSQLKDF